MDLNQRKLTRDEWNSIEVPISAEEQVITKLIQEGYDDVTLRQNNTLSLLRYLKIPFTEAIDAYVYCQYLEKEVSELTKTYGFEVERVTVPKNAIRKRDIIRFSNTDKQLASHKDGLFEFVLLDLVSNMMKNKKRNSDKWLFYYYTLKVLSGYSVVLCNQSLLRVIAALLGSVEPDVNIRTLVSIGRDVIERNNYLLRYADMQLYDHQKRLFTACKRENPKLIQYIAPTGTGKTLSPLGLAQGHKVIFVCAARHVGLALAKAAISSHRKVAFAFGCGDAEDIRLHYFAAKDYVRHRKSGRICKVDNSVGDKVEIMISDIKSYLPAMYYMLAFNPKEKIILYWDEPTITMDYDDHEFHSIIQKNWRENLIPNVVLSSATLPQREDMQTTIGDFRARFDEAEIHSIVSHDCKKTIPLINKAGFVEMPHYISDDYNETMGVVEHCERYKTLMRYIDLGEAVRFVMTAIEMGYVETRRLQLERHFPGTESVNMTNIKEYYLKVLGSISDANWPALRDRMKETRTKTQKSNIHVVTKDAHTLTDGPTIFLADDVGKIARFCVQEAKIPPVVASDIMDAIRFNSVINEKVAALQKTYEDGTKEDEGKEKKMSEGRVSPEMRRIMNQITELQACVRSVELNPMFVPNTKEHQERFAGSFDGKPFACDIGPNAVEKIMLIDDVDDTWKMLLLMGIGVFASHESDRYTEVMKDLAQRQKLYLIIASSDYIYGTNYQFCHGYVSKDLGYMSQEKAIQAMGRVGRNKLQQEYSLRFRDDSLITKLFFEEEDKPEVRNMARLFST